LTLDKDVELNGLIRVLYPSYFNTHVWLQDWICWVAFQLTRPA
jgi:hypothetical protein